MYGFELVTTNYKRLIKQGKINENDIKRDIYISELLEDLRQEDFYTMVDYGAFDYIIKTYCEEALIKAKVGRSVERRVKAHLEMLLEERDTEGVIEHNRKGRERIYSSPEVINVKKFAKLSEEELSKTVIDDVKEARENVKKEYLERQKELQSKIHELEPVLSDEDYTLPEGFMSHEEYNKN